MSWNRQMEEMVGAWTDMQRNMWDGWLRAVKGFGDKGGGGSEVVQREYRRNLEAWERSVREALESQAQWTRVWADKIGEQQADTEASRQWVEQTQAMMKGWTEAQAQLWNAWFDSIKGLDANQAAGRWESEGQQVLQAWQEATQRAQETLAEWAQAVSEQAPETESADAAEVPPKGKRKR